MKFVMHGQCGDGTTVTFLTAQLPMISSKLYCLVTGEHVCECLVKKP